MNFIKKPFFLLLFSILIIFQSCNNENIDAITEVIITTSNSNLLVDDTVTFSATANNGNDITNQTTFYVNNEVLTGNNFTPNASGTYEIKSIYNSITSNTIEITASNPTGYSQKVLAEDYTGTWCGYCPRIAYAIQQAELQSDKIVPVAIHLAKNSTDVYNFDGSEELENLFNIGGLPEGRLNRTIIWNYPQNTNLNQALDLTGQSSPLGLAIQSEINQNTINTTVRVGFAQDYNFEIGIVVYLLESGLIHDQTNYTNFFPEGQYVDPLVDFEHNDVLRGIFTNALGEIIPQTETVNGNTYVFSIQNTIPTSIENNNNLSLVAFVVNKNTNEVLNAQHAAVGENHPFD